MTCLAFKKWNPLKTREKKPGRKPRRGTVKSDTEKCVTVTLWTQGPSCDTEVTCLISDPSREGVLERESDLLLIRSECSADQRTRKTSPSVRLKNENKREGTGRGRRNLNLYALFICLSYLLSRSKTFVRACFGLCLPDSLSRRTRGVKAREERDWRDWRESTNLPTQCDALAFSFISLSVHFIFFASFSVCVGHSFSSLSVCG